MQDSYWSWHCFNALSKHTDDSRGRRMSCRFLTLNVDQTWRMLYLFNHCVNHKQDNQTADNHSSICARFCLNSEQLVKLNHITWHLTCSNRTAPQCTKRGPCRHGWASGRTWLACTESQPRPGKSPLGLEESEDFKPSLLIQHQCLTSQMLFWMNNQAFPKAHF